MVDTFWGVPFAAPPVGGLRFKAPVPPKDWTTTFDATKKPPACPQGKAIGKEHQGTEDCLTLDVYTPTGRSATEKLPVMVWIHGGGDSAGTSHGDLTLPGLEEVYDGRRFVNQHNVVMVNLNYRLGVLGWLALEPLRHEDPNGSVGNWGLMDQRMGLQWVQDNVEAFGGDKHSVTVFGESAGGTAICAHWVSPASRGLFHRLIGESAPCTGTMPFIERPIAENFGKLWTEKLGCWKGDNKQTLDCLRKLPVATVLQPDLVFSWELPKNVANLPLPSGVPLFAFWDVIDGTKVGIPDHPRTLIAKGKFNDVSVLMGNNRNEGTLFTIVTALAINETLPFDQKKWSKLIHFLVNNNKTRVDAINKMYPASDYTSQDHRVNRVLTHSQIACPERVMVRNAITWNKAHSRSTDMYMYLFNRSFVGVDPKLGVYHSSEIPYVFNNEIPYILWDEHDRKLSHQMGAYWAAFARAGNPNAVDPKHKCDGCISWPVYSATNAHHPKNTNQHLVLQKELTYKEGLYGKFCDFWDNLGYDILPSPS